MGNKTEKSSVSDIAFTRAVKDIQSRKGSRGGYEKMERGIGWKTQVDENLAQFIGQQNSFFIATVNGDGQPYIQHRGGPKGFLKVLDESTLAFADYSGNRQYVSMGNLTENPRIHLFLIDYARRMRVKIWGDAKVVEGDSELVRSLMPKDYTAEGERAFVITIKAWDRNCPQHIPLRFEAEDVEKAIHERDERIRILEEELQKYRSLVPQT